MGEDSSKSPKGQYDPGWNDPPKLQYNPTQQTGKTKLNLNKRIAFPIQGSSSLSTSKPTAIVQPSPSCLPLTTIPTATSSPSQPPVAIVPPMPQLAPPLQRVPPLNTTTISTNINSAAELSDVDTQNEELPENAREFCLNTFQNFISRIQESSNVRREEIQRRINLMNQMWLNGTLNTLVHRKLVNIAKALETNNFSEAIENHRGLVVDHSNICTAWAAALRQIILTIQVNSSCSEQHSSMGDNEGPIPPNVNVSNILVPAIPSDTSNIGSQSEFPETNIQHI